jgi:DNA topoisomerase-1
MAPEAVEAARAAIRERFGASYVPDRPRLYKTKAKNAQEAHECIRPTELSRGPDRAGELDGDQRRLYELIWKRAIASQMEAARLERTTVEIGSADGAVALRATGQVVKFDGFLRVYDESRDDDDGEDGARLPPIAAGEPARKPPFYGSGLAAERAKLDARALPEGTVVAPEAPYVAGEAAILAVQSHTQPPPRYTEATLVKRMEELGIGRPSTYASILDTIETRDYVRKDKNRLIPQDKGRLVTAFLENYFSRYVEYDFTADLEERLDDVSGGRADWKALLRAFWEDFAGAVEETKDLRISEVIDRIDAALAPHLFPDRDDGADPRRCGSCGTGRLGLKTGKFGAFIGCSNYPECRYTRPLGGAEAAEAEGLADGRVLGHDPDGLAVTLRLGRFGPYVQLGEATEAQPKPKRASLPKGLGADALTLERALSLLALPRRVGLHPDDGEPVEAGIGRFGPYLRHGATWANVPKDEDVLTIGMNRAVELIAQKRAGGARRGGAAAEPLRVLGEHPAGGAVALHAGRYGPYVRWGAVNATLPKDVAPEALTLDAALALVAAKAPAKKPSKAKPRAKAAAAAPAGSEGPAARPARKAAATKAPAKPKAAAATGPAASKAAGAKAPPKPKAAAPRPARKASGEN